MHLTAIRYQAERGGPWKNALAVGSPAAIAEHLERQGTRLKVYERGDTYLQPVTAARLPDGRVYDTIQQCYVEHEENAHA